MNGYPAKSALSIKQSWKLIFALSLVLLTSLFLPGTPAAHASSKIPQASNRWIVAPTVQINPNCGDYSNNVFEFTDGFGIPSAFTYTNGSSYCVSVWWYIPSDVWNFYKDCSYYVYIPKGNQYGAADTYINYGYWYDNLQGGEGTGLVGVDQNSYEGYYKLFSRNSLVKRIQMADNNGTYGQHLGWRRDEASLIVDCIW